MQKYKYVLDLEENIYSFNSDFDNYKLSNEKIKKLHSEPISDKDSKYIDSKIVYDHTYIYLTPGDFIEQYKLHNNQKIELYDDIGKIKIKDIISEKIKDISFILHHMLTIRAQEEADVQGYEMPINNYWHHIPFNHRINFSIENIFNSQKKAMETQSELENYMFINTRDTLFLSNEATNILKQKENINLNDFYEGFSNRGLNNIEEGKNNVSASEINEPGDINSVESKGVNLEDPGNKLLAYSDIQKVFGLKKNPTQIGDNKYEVSGQINKQIQKNKSLVLDSTPVKSSYGILGSDRKIDYLIQDNHPEKILGDGVGLIGKHTVPQGNNLITSYHDNRVTEETEKSKKSRNIIYNFTAPKENTEITFHRANFSIDKSKIGVKAGALAVGDKFKDGNLNGLMDNAYLKDPDGKVINLKEELNKLKEQGKEEELKKLKDKIIEKDGKLTVKLNSGETFSFQATPTLENEDIFASAIEFESNKDIDIEIRSTQKENTSPQNSKEAYKEWFEAGKDLKNEKGYDEITNYNKNGEAKQVSGVFPKPNYDITGTITAGNKDNADKSTIIRLPPPEIKDNPIPLTGTPVKLNEEKYYSTGKNEQGEDVINDGAFSQNFHYKLEISNYNPAEQYAVVVVPGADPIAPQGQSNPEIAKANVLDKTSITLPSKIIKENGKYYIEFDYFVVGGSGNPASAKIIEKTSLNL